MPHPVSRWTHLLAVAGTAVLTLVVAILALLQLPPVATWAMQRLVTVVPLNPGYRLEVGRVSGDWLHRLMLADVRLIQNRRELARIDRLGVSYDLRQLRGAVTRLRELTVDGAQAVAHREADGWNLASALRHSTDTTKHGGGIRVERLELRDVELGAQLSPDSMVRVRGLKLSGRDLVVGDQVLLTLDQLNAAVSPPGSARWFALATRGAVTADEFRFDPLRIQTEETRIAGRVMLPRDLRDTGAADRLDVRLDATPLALADLAAIAPSVPPEGDLWLNMSAKGDRDGLVTAHLGARLDEAMLNVNGTAPLTGGRAGYRVNGSMRRLDPARLYRTAPIGSLNGTVDAKLGGPSLQRSEGRLALLIAPSRLGGRSLHRLELRADLTGGNAAVELRGALEQGMVSATGHVRPFDKVPEYRLRGSAIGLPGSEIVARKLTGDSAVSLLETRFQIAGAGLSPATARLTGTVSLAARRATEGQLPLGRATFRLDRGQFGLNPELRVGGGLITAHAFVRLGDTLSYQLRDGKIEQVDLARLTADTSLGAITARFSLQGRGTALAQAVASTRLTLDKLRYGAHELRGLAGEARLVRGQARIEFGGSIQGGRFALLADGRPFDQTKTFQLRRASFNQVDLGSFLGRPDLAGPVTLHATAQGRIRGESRSVRGRLTMEPSRLGKVELTGGSAEVELTGDRLTYDGSLNTSGGTLTLAGEGHPFAGVPSFAIRRGQADSIDLGTLLGRPALSTSINARFTAQLSVDSSSGKQASLTIQLLPSRINRAELQSGNLAASMKGDALQSRLRITGRDGELTADLNGRTGEAMQMHGSGSLRLERLARWTGRPDADGRLESSFVLNAVSDSAGLTAFDGTVDAIGGIGDIRLTAAHLVVQPDSGAIRVDTIVVRSNVADLDGGGRIALRGVAGSDTLRINGISYNLTPIAGLVGDSITLDSARLAVTVTGPAWRWRVQSEAQVNGLLAAGNLADRVTLQASADLDSTRLSGIQGELRAKDAAYGKTRIPEARLQGRYDSLLTVEADVALGDSARVVTALRGSVRGDTTRATLQRLDLTQPDGAWSLEQPAQLELRPRFVIDGFAVRSGGRRILVDGVYDPKATSDIGLRITKLDLGALRSLGLVPVGGVLDGWLRLQGPAADPKVEGKLGLGIPQKNGREIGRLLSDIVWNRDGLHLNAAAVPVRGGRLTVSGSLPWRLKLTPTDSGTAVGLAPGSADTLALAVQSDSFDLGVLDPLLPPDVAHDLRGRLLAQVRIAGTPAAPQANGAFRITGVTVTLPPLGLSYRDGQLLGEMSGDELRIERLQLSTNKKELLTAQGTVRLRPLSDPPLDLTARLRQFRISNSPALQAVATGDLRLQGTATKPLLTGNLTMGRTDIVVGGGAAAATVEKVELSPEDLRQVARHFGPTVVAQAHKSPGLVDRFHLDLNLRLPRQVWFRRRTSPKAEIELSGRIRLTQEPGQPMQFFGRVEPVPGRGTLDVYGREFRLTGGEIRLAGPTDSTTLDVTAEYQVPTQGGPEDEGVIINVAAKGHPDSLALEFSGDPEMSQDDMLSYIVTGRPSSDNPLAERSTGGESTGEMGAEVAMSSLTQNLSTAAEKELGLDVFQIRQEGLHGLTLTAGRYVGSSVFLSMHLPIELGSAEQQMPGSNLGPSFELEYAIQRWLRANVQGGNVPPRFTLRSRYAY